MGDGRSIWSPLSYPGFRFIVIFVSFQFFLGNMCFQNNVASTTLVKALIGLFHIFLSSSLLPAILSEPLLPPRMLFSWLRFLFHSYGSM